MTSIEILEKLGIIIKDYFEDITPSNEYFYLLVDEFMFENFLEKLQKKDNISPREVYSSIKKSKCNCHGNPNVAIAIASYQVMIFYSLNKEASPDAYNEKLLSSKAYRDTGITYQEYWYQETAPHAPEEGQALQEKLWALLKKSFKIANIPDNKKRNEMDRYVQFPKSQNILDTSIHTFRIQYADQFIKKGLEPNQGITYQEFSDLFFDKKQDYDHEILKRLVFSFYCMWDGNSYQEIIEGKCLTREQREKEAKTEFCIQIYDKVEIYINKEPINLNESQIDDKYLYRFNKHGIINKGYVFIKDSDYNDWIPYNRAIDPEEEILVLTTEKADFPKNIEDLITKGEIEVISAGMYKVLILSLKDRESFDHFEIKFKQNQYFYLEGGIKSKRNTYYPFALPIIKLTENTKYQNIYIDSKKHPIEHKNTIRLENMPPGKHTIKISDSWDSAEIIFYVEDGEYTRPKNISFGWVLNNIENKVYPSNNTDKPTVTGLNLCGNLSWIERSNVNKNIKGKTKLRSFLQLNEKLKNRFNIIGNIKIEKGEWYGN